MNHQDVINRKLVERYLLNEMTEKDRGAFEEHYFSCADCAQDVLSAAKFIENARRPLEALETGADGAATAADRWWDRWLALAPKPALAAGCVFLAAGWIGQNLAMTAAPEVTGSYFVTATRAAGGPRKIAVLPGQQRVGLLFNYTDASVAKFRFVLEDRNGGPLLRFDGDAPGDTNDIQVMIPVTDLRSGTYTLRARNAATGVEVAALPFELVIP
jgi:hypothetical protein